MKQFAVTTHRQTLGNFFDRTKSQAFMISLDVKKLLLTGGNRFSLLSILAHLLVFQFLVKIPTTKAIVCEMFCDQFNIQFNFIYIMPKQ